MLVFDVVFVRKLFVRNSRKSIRKFLSEVFCQKFSVRKFSILMECKEYWMDLNNRIPFDSRITCIFHFSFVLKSTQNIEILNYANNLGCEMTQRGSKKTTKNFLKAEQWEITHISQASKSESLGSHGAANISDFLQNLSPTTLFYINAKLKQI